jgi:hypothetical protein
MELQKIIEVFGSGLFLMLGVLAILLGAIFIIRWLLLPFAVFGIRSRMDRAAVQMTEMRSQLQHLINILDPDGTKARLHEQFADTLAAQRTAECPHCHRKIELKKLSAGEQHECPYCLKGIQLAS